MINLEISKRHEETFAQVMMLAEHMMRPYSRKYDKEEHTYPKEMEEVSQLIAGGRSEATSKPKEKPPEGTIVNGGNMGSVIGLFGLCWGDVGLFLGMPGSGLGNQDRWEAFEKANLDELVEPGESRTAFLLRFTLSHPHCHTTIVGTLNPHHLAENVAVAQQGALPADVYAEAKQRLDAAGERPE